MRDLLVGYLLGSLEAEEHQKVETELEHNTQLQHELELLQGSLEPLEAVEEIYEPPAGLADRASQNILDHVATRAPAALAESEARRSPWSIADVAVAAGVFLAAGLMLFPALQHSRASARMAACQNNLRILGSSLLSFADRHDGQFPKISERGPTSFAGMHPVMLKEAGLLPDERVLVCPSSELAEREQPVIVPTRHELERMSAAQLKRVQQLAGGSFGFPLGYIENGKYYGVKNLSRKGYPIAADAASPHLDEFRSMNHGKCGQNVLYEDGHLAFQKQCRSEGCSDHIYLNERRMIAAGVHRNDAVIGSSASSPIVDIVPVGFEGN